MIQLLDRKTGRLVGTYKDGIAAGKAAAKYAQEQHRISGRTWYLDLRLAGPVTGKDIVDFGEARHTHSRELGRIRGQVT